MKHGKKYNEAAAKVDRTKAYEVDEAVALVKDVAFAKFDESVEVSIKLNIKKNHTVRDTLVLPHQFGEEKKILVFAKGEKAEEAKEAGAAYVGDADLIDKIKGGWLDFDVAVATPDMMRDVGRLGPVLGRRGLMPNPKTRTVTTDVKGAIAELKQGRLEFRADKTGIVHMRLGKVSMDPKALAENVNTFIQEVTRKRPHDLKGMFFKSVYISSSMGPGIPVAYQEEQ